MADEWAKPELGTGCVKITPAHDPNDYDVGQRQNLPMINILNPDGTLNDERRPVPRPDRDEGPRATSWPTWRSWAWWRRSRTARSTWPTRDRSKTPIEPYLTDQWFVQDGRAGPDRRMDAVTDGRVKIIPERYAKGYLDWLSEKRDWPISRQLWWGHRIPVWYCDDRPARRICKQAFAGRDDVVVAARRARHGQLARSAPRKPTWPKTPMPGPQAATQEPDVLDTWFSSALWPHSTLGWPEQTPELKYYYPTSVLITSRDIITLWVARMVLTGLYNVGDVPFHDVFIHPKILDGYGEGMSKSKGNGVDPLDVIEKFGADSLRFGLAYLTTETQDVRMPVEFECPHCQQADRADQGEPHAAADQVQAVRQAVFDAMGREAGRQGPAARRGGERALRAGPQLLQQAVERLAVRADEPRRLRRRARWPTTSCWSRTAGS